MWIELLAVAIFVYSATVVIVTIAEISMWSDAGNREYTTLTPNHLHYYTEMNWFGCYATWILLGIVSPFVFIVKFFWFIFHIGKFEDIL